MTPEFRRMLELRGTVPPTTPGQEPLPGQEAGLPAATAPNEISSVMLIFRAISLGSDTASANQAIAYPLLEELKASPLFDPSGTEFSTGIMPDDTTGTFTFGVTLKLKEPLKL